MKRKKFLGSVAALFVAPFAVAKVDDGVRKVDLGDGMTGYFKPLPGLDSRSYPLTEDECYEPTAYKTVLEGINWGGSVATGNGSYIPCTTKYEESFDETNYHGWIFRETKHPVGEMLFQVKFSLDVVRTVVPEHEVKERCRKDFLRLLIMKGIYK